MRKEGRTEGNEVEKLLFRSHIGLFPMVLALTLMNDAASLFFFPSLSLPLPCSLHSMAAGRCVYVRVRICVCWEVGVGVGGAVQVM